MTQRDRVVAVESAYDDAWNAGDIEALVALFTDDAILVNPRGGVATGKDELRTALGGLLAGEAKGSTHASTATRVSFIGDDTAIFDGVARIDGLAPTTVVHSFTDVLVRRGDRWLIAHVRAYAMPEPDFGRD